MTPRDIYNKTAPVASKVAGAVWRSPVCKIHRFFYKTATEMTQTFLKPDKKGVRENLPLYSYLIAGAGLALAAAFVYGAATVGGSALVIAGGYALAADVVGAGVFTALGAASILLLNISTAMGLGAMKAAVAGLKTYYDSNADAIIATRPPEELAEAQAAHLARLEAAEAFRAAAARPETGADIQPMKQLVLRGSGGVKNPAKSA